MILIYSKSLRVIEAKLRVYREYQNIIDPGNIYLHHVYEDMEELAKLSAHKKISNLHRCVRELKNTFDIENVPYLIKYVADTVLTEEKIRGLCFGVRINDIGNVESNPFICCSEREVKKIRDILIKETLKKIGKCLKSELCVREITPFHSQLKVDLTSYYTDFKFYPFSLNPYLNQYLTIGLIILFRDIPMLRMHVFTYIFFLSEFTGVDVNSKGWRKSIADDIYINILKKRDTILQDILKTITRLRRCTSKELESVLGNLRGQLKNISILQQREGK